VTTDFTGRPVWPYPAYDLHPNDSHLTGTIDSHTGTDDEQNLHFRENVHTENMVAPTGAFAANSPWEVPRLQPSRHDIRRPTLLADRCGPTRLTTYTPTTVISRAPTTRTPAPTTIRTFTLGRTRKRGRWRPRQRKLRRADSRACRRCGRPRLDFQHWRPCGVLANGGRS
jgi:hypothetical protein